MAVPIDSVTSTDSPTSIHVRGTLGSFSPTSANQQNKIQVRLQRLPVISVSPGKRQNIAATSTRRYQEEINHSYTGLTILDITPANTTMHESVTAAGSHDSGTARNAPSMISLSIVKYDPAYGMRRDATPQGGCLSKQYHPVLPPEIGVNETIERALAKNEQQQDERGYAQGGWLHDPHLSGERFTDHMNCVAT